MRRHSLDIVPPGLQVVGTAATGEPKGTPRGLASGASAKRLPVQEAHDAALLEVERSQGRLGAPTHSGSGAATPRSLEQHRRRLSNTFAPGSLAPLPPSVMSPTTILSGALPLAGSRPSTSHTGRHQHPSLRRSTSAPDSQSKAQGAPPADLWGRALAPLRTGGPAPLGGSPAAAAAAGPTAAATPGSSGATPRSKPGPLTVTTTTTAPDIKAWLTVTTAPTALLSPTGSSRKQAAAADGVRLFSPRGPMSPAADSQGGSPRLLSTDSNIAPSDTSLSPHKGADKARRFSAARYQSPGLTEEGSHSSEGSDGQHGGMLSPTSSTLQSRRGVSGGQAPPPGDAALHTASPFAASAARPTAASIAAAGHQRRASLASHELPLVHPLSSVLSNGSSAASTPMARPSRSNLAVQPGTPGGAGQGPSTPRNALAALQLMSAAPAAAAEANNADAARAGRALTSPASRPGSSHTPPGSRPGSGRSLGVQALVDAVRSKDTGQLAAVLAQLTKPDGAVAFINDRHAVTGRTALAEAVMVNQLSMVQQLLACGASPNIAHVCAGPPLLHAAAWGEQGMADLLLSAGAAVNATDVAGFTALHYACSGNHLDAARLLLQHGARLDMANRDGQVPLDLAQPGVAEALLAEAEASAHAAAKPARPRPITIPKLQQLGPSVVPVRRGSSSGNLGTSASGQAAASERPSVADVLASFTSPPAAPATASRAADKPTAAAPGGRPAAASGANSRLIVRAHALSPGAASTATEESSSPDRVAAGMMSPGDATAPSPRHSPPPQLRLPDGIQRQLSKERQGQGRDGDGRAAAAGVGLEALMQGFEAADKELVWQSVERPQAFAVAAKGKLAAGGGTSRAAKAIARASMALQQLELSARRSCSLRGLQAEAAAREAVAVADATATASAAAHPGTAPPKIMFGAPQGASADAWRPAQPASSAASPSVMSPHAIAFFAMPMAPKIMFGVDVMEAPPLRDEAPEAAALLAASPDDLIRTVRAPSSAAGTGSTLSNAGGAAAASGGTHRPAAAQHEWSPGTVVMPAARGLAQVGAALEAAAAAAAAANNNINAAPGPSGSATSSTYNPSKAVLPQLLEDDSPVHSGDGSSKGLMTSQTLRGGLQHKLAAPVASTTSADGSARYSGGGVPPLLLDRDDSPQHSAQSRLSAAAAAVDGMELGDEDDTGMQAARLRAAQLFGQSTDMCTGPIQWTCGDLLGEGANGRVFAGLNQVTGELMAVKVVELAGRAGQPGGDARVAELRSELDVCKRLSHKHVVQYIDAHYDGASQQLHIFLEYVPGGSIASMLARFGRFSDELVRRYTRQLLEGLEYLHGQLVVHRDLKGDNILVTRDGIVKLADFGASKAFKDATITDGMKSVRGSVYWMAPEVIRGTGYGRKADIWSLGCTVIEMLTAKHPWRDLDNPWTAMFCIAKSETGPPRPADMPPGCADFLDRCLALDPKQRLTAAQLLQHPFVADVAPA